MFARDFQACGQVSKDIDGIGHAATQRLLCFIGINADDNCPKSLAVDERRLNIARQHCNGYLALG